MPVRSRVPFFLFLFSFLLSFVLLGAWVGAQAPVRGTVSDPAGLPVQGANVRLIDSAHSERAQTETDERGNFVLSAVCSGCQVEVTRPGFEAISIPADSGHALSIVLTLAAVREAVVVTATGRETPGSQVGTSATVLEREDIEQRHALSTIDLLRSVPGVIAARSGGIGTLTSLYVRGGESSYNKVLLDGIPLNEPGGSFNFSSLAPENIDRIEVLRGAHSALFGSDAMASVIQIFTVKPTAGRDRPEATVAIDGGTYNTGHVSGGLAGVAHAVEYSLFGSRLATDNRAPNNVNRSTTVSGTVTSGASSAGVLHFIGRGDFGTTGTPGATGFGRPDSDALFKHRNGEGLAGWTRQFGGRATQHASYSFAVTHQESRNLTVDPPYTAQLPGHTANDSSSDYPYHSTAQLHRHHVDYRADVSVRSNQNLTVAFAYDGERGELANLLSTPAPSKPTRNNTGTTVQYEALAGPLSVVGGIRFEDNGSFGAFAAPRGSASWLIRTGDSIVGSTRFRANAGLGIKEPTFLQSYSQSVFSLGNPDLSPEKSRSIDAGLEQRFAHDRLRIEGTFFANHFDDLIDLRETDSALFASQYFNIGESRARGMELVAEAVIPNGFQLKGYYTFVASKILRSTSSTPVFTPGQPLFRRPRHSGYFQAMFARGRWNVTTSAVFVGSRVDSDFDLFDPPIVSDPAYATWSATGGLRFGRALSTFVVIENLANRDYMDPLGYPALGRTVRVGARARF